MKLIAIPAYQAWSIYAQTCGCEQIWSRSPVNPNSYDLVLGMEWLKFDGGGYQLHLYEITRIIEQNDPLYIDEQLFNEFLNPETE
ncbi:putative secreted protein [Stenotrophomonas phage Marzo]|nr:putative secreted protein [Stenotrophomonas phage Marzo]